MFQHVKAFFVPTRKTAIFQAREKKRDPHARNKKLVAVVVVVVENNSRRYRYRYIQCDDGKQRD